MTDRTSRPILVLASGFIYRPRASNNLGDRAQLTRTVERLRKAFPESRLVAISNSINDEAHVDDLEMSYMAIRYLTSPIRIPLGETRIPQGAARVLRVLLFLANARRAASNKRSIFMSRVGQAALDEMEASRALFISGAGAFNDLYLTGTGGFWSVVVRCMSVLGKPVVASGQQIGPLRRFSRRAVARWVLPSVDLLGVRDPMSVTTALAVNVHQQRIVLTGDDAWDLAAATSAALKPVLIRNGIQEPFIAAQIRFGPSVGWSEADAEDLATSLSHLSSTLESPIVFVPCDTGDAHDDREAASRVREHLDVPSWEITEELDAQTTKAVLGRAVLGVGTANHFCVFAASMGTPVIGLYSSSYMQQKIVGLAELWPARVAPLPKETALKPAALVATARQLLDRRADRTVGDAQPAIELHPDEPIRVLTKLLSHVPRREHGSGHGSSSALRDRGRRIRNSAERASYRTRFQARQMLRCPLLRNRTDLLNYLALRTNASRYLEIGVSDPLVNYDRIRVPHKHGVDPAPRGPISHVSRSDDFFAELDRSPYAEPYDLIFVDGHHTAEQAEIDIQNALRWITPHGYIVVHDCNPVDEAEQVEFYDGTSSWCGTVWKAWVKLRATRGDLAMRVVDLDHGCGIIQRGHQTCDVAKSAIADGLTYDVLAQNREELLNLITADTVPIYY
jgi:polysaccharide pyruvyl transferase WcaK-like protein